MPEYQVKDRETGQIVRFRWDGPSEPSDAEFAEIFQAARRQQVRGPNWRMASPLGATVGALAGGLLGGPIGAVAGAGLGGGAGKAAELTMQPDDELPGVLDRLLAATVSGGQQALVEAGGQGLAALTRPVARGLMQSALKPDADTVQSGRSLGLRSKSDVADFVLNEPVGRFGGGAYVTRGSLDTVRDQIDDINRSIQDVLATAGKQGATVPPNVVAGPIGEQAQRALMQVNPHRDLSAVNDVYDEFLSHPLLQPGGLPIEDAQRLKVGTYAKMREQYGELGSATVEANKALARGLKEGIATQAPEVAAANLRESRLLVLENALEKALARTGNRDPIGFANAAPATKRFWLALADRSPNVKIAIARALNVPVRRVFQMAPTLLRAGEIGLSALPNTPEASGR